eukprot:m.392609 g.392609  ORF g.392609 m.392609 type:complete len:65 (-) comp28325_c0_seq15:69-263(-)
MKHEAWPTRQCRTFEHTGLLVHTAHHEMNVLSITTSRSTQFLVPPVLSLSLSFCPRLDQINKAT